MAKYYKAAYSVKNIACNNLWPLRKTRHWLYAWSFWRPKAKKETNKGAEAQSRMTCCKYLGWELGAGLALNPLETRGENVITFTSCGMADTENIAATQAGAH